VIRIRPAVFVNATAKFRKNRSGSCGGIFSKKVSDQKILPSGVVSITLVHGDSLLGPEVVPERAGKGGDSRHPWPEIYPARSRQVKIFDVTLSVKEGAHAL